MKRTILAAGLFSAALTANASDLDYNFVEGSYNKVDVEGESFDGFGIKGSYAFNDSFYGFAGYQQNDDDALELSETTIGLGFRKALNAKTDWTNEVSFVSNDIDLSAVAGIGGGSENGYRVATGVRSLLTDKFELNGNLNYTDVSNFGNGIGAGVGAIYHVNNTWGLTANYNYGQRDDVEINNWGVGVRASF